MNKPKISVIVPVYNTEKYLRKCLDSLVFQTLEEIEIIAVDDGSTDQSGLILDEYQDKYPQKMKVVHKENGGQASARNLAFDLCTGEYIGFLDSDDFVKTDMFEKMYQKAVVADADYVACGYTDIMYDDEKEIVLQEYVASKPAYKTKDMFFEALVSPFLHIYRRELLVKSGVKFTQGYIYEDTAFYLNLIPYVKKLEVLEESLAYRVRHANSTTTTFKKEKVRNIIPVIQDSVDFYKNNNHFDEYKNELEYFCVKVLLCSSMQRISRVAGYKNSVDLADETLEYIANVFPKYRSNPYFNGGMKNLYMKSYSKLTARIYLLLFKITNRFKRVYT